VLVLIGSYIFYGWWDWRFLLLIILSTLVDFVIGKKISTSNYDKTKKQLLGISLAVNLGILGVFKYYNFFLDSLYDIIPGLKVVLGFNTLDIILPVGISFYTFQTLSYTIDIYRGKLRPSKDFIAFAAFVSFFPQLVAGPIERASNLLPQFYTKRKFEYEHAVNGLRQILWGFFKKIVIADNCAEFANYIFDNSSDASGSTLILGAFFFAFQIYGDFSGYSDIAIGTSKLLGFDLMKNFAYPYFARDIAEFWRRWHISLSTWFRDYLYIPLGGSRVKDTLKIRNIFIIFIVSGFWHGANWTFIVWGALNALYFLPLMLTNKNRKNLDTVAQDKYLPNPREALNMLYTFSLTTLAWVFFRSTDIVHAIEYLSGIFSHSIFSIPEIPNKLGALITLIFILVFTIIEWIGRERDYAIEKFAVTSHPILRYSFYYAIIIAIVWHGGKEQEFIYFQF
jgi:D-alanyl-lipoteichoic acid acyltransferase DltB (MBOAT superfamily)